MLQGAVDFDAMSVTLLLPGGWWFRAVEMQADDYDACTRALESCGEEEEQKEK
jgi:hypothetical protein